jgi:hypothetical protein
MLTRLREAIEECEIFPVAGELEEALELRSRLDAKISAAVGDFDAAGLYELDQATSMTAWLRHPLLRRGGGRPGARRRDDLTAAVRRRHPPLRDGGALGDPRLRHHHPLRARPVVERPGAARHPLPGAGL